jgi:hypothetical protein
MRRGCSAGSLFHNTSNVLCVDSIRIVICRGYEAAECRELRVSLYKWLDQVNPAFELTLFVFNNN